MAAKDYQHILVATDFSEHARLAAERGAREAAHYGAQLTLLHVIEHFPIGMPTEWVAPEDQDPATYYRAKSARELQALADALDQGSARQEVIVTESSATHAMIDFAAREHVDLIVAGLRGRWVVGMLGSTALAIVHQAPCDVLLVR